MHASMIGAPNASNAVHASSAPNVVYVMMGLRGLFILVRRVVQGLYKPVSLGSGRVWCKVLLAFWTPSKLTCLKLE